MPPTVGVPARRGEGEEGDGSLLTNLLIFPIASSTTHIVVAHLPQPHTHSASLPILTPPSLSPSVPPSLPLFLSLFLSYSLILSLSSFFHSLSLSSLSSLSLDSLFALVTSLQIYWLSCLPCLASLSLALQAKRERANASGISPNVFHCCLCRCRVLHLPPPQHTHKHTHTYLQAHTHIHTHTHRRNSPFFPPHIYTYTRTTLHTLPVPFLSSPHSA